MKNERSAGLSTRDLLAAPPKASLTMRADGEVIYAPPPLPSSRTPRPTRPKPDLIEDLQADTDVSPTPFSNLETKGDVGASRDSEAQRHRGHQDDQSDVQPLGHLENQGDREERGNLDDAPAATERALTPHTNTVAIARETLAAASARLASRHLDRDPPPRFPPKSSTAAQAIPATRPVPTPLAGDAPAAASADSVVGATTPTAVENAEDLVVSIQVDVDLGLDDEPVPVAPTHFGDVALPDHFVNGANVLTDDLALEPIRRRRSSTGRADEAPQVTPIGPKTTDDAGKLTPPEGRPSVNLRQRRIRERSRSDDLQPIYDARAELLYREAARAVGNRDFVTAERHLALALSYMPNEPRLVDARDKVKRLRSKMPS